MHVLADCENGDLRLQGGQSHEGFVQYCWNGVWSTVCTLGSGRWQREEAIVACTQLGYQFGKSI